MINIDDLDLTDPQQLQNISKEIALADIQVLIETLKKDLAMPLPEDLDGQAKAVSGRAEMIKQIQALNNIIKTPEIEIANLQDVEITQRRWMTYPFLPESEVTLLTGQGGVGKSFLLLQIGSLLAAGYTDANLSLSELTEGNHYHFFVQPELTPCWVEPQPVVYASYEDDMSEIRRRMNTLYNGFGWFKEKQSIIFKNFHPIGMRGIGPVWAPEMGKHFQTRSQPTRAADNLKKECESKEAKLLMIDPLSACFYGDENNKAEVYAFVNSWAEWGEETQTAVVISGHLPKGKEARRSGYSGTAAWEGAVRSLFTLDIFDMNENEDGDREKDGNKNRARRWYLAFKGIKGNYTKIDGVEIPVIRGKDGSIEHTGETDIGKAKDRSHEVVFKKRKNAPTQTQEDTDDESGDNPYANAFK